MSAEAIDLNVGVRLFSLLFVAHTAWVVFKAMRTGRISPTRADREYVRRQEPTAFWFHIIANVVVGFTFLMTAAVKPRLMLLGFGVLFAYLAVNAIKIGKVKPSSHDRIYTRSADPGTYWFHVFVEVVVASALLAAGIRWGLTG